MRARHGAFTWSDNLDKQLTPASRPSNRAGAATIVTTDRNTQLGLWHEYISDFTTCVAVGGEAVIEVAPRRKGGDAVTHRIPSGHFDFGLVLGFAELERPKEEETCALFGDF